jgi:hypothetical protein
MIGKLLLTLVIIALAALYLRKRYQQDKRNKLRASAEILPARTTGNTELDSFLSQARRSGGNAADAMSEHGGNTAAHVKIVLWAALGIVLVTGSVASYWYWQDQQRLVTVLLHRSTSEAPVIYRVPKRNLGDMEFVTDNGIRVTVSANERMEVVGL